MRFLRSQDAGIPSTKRETGLKRMKFWEKSRDFFGEVLYVCRAPQTGVILYQAASLSILEETPMITYAYL